MSIQSHPEGYYTNARHDVLREVSGLKLQKVLEVGGGEFPTLKLMSARAEIEAWGVDLICPANPPANFIQGSFEDPNISLSLPEEYFDLIMMNDVLEHLWDTAGVLRRSYQLLKKGGTIVVSVPNVRQIRFPFTVLIRGTFPRNTSGMFDHTHRRWFTKKDITQCINSAGFAVKSAKSFGRLVPERARNTIFGELLGLHNIIVAEKLD
jgi:2-polyprenyl-3-methyl-5-hydroxy-6-metoxy-1,4-benzoquinol methylase